LIQLVSKKPNGLDSVHQTITDIPLSEPITDIPEYHDCQRFIEFGGYGSVYAVFAAFRLDHIAGGPMEPLATIYTPNGRYSPLGIEPGFNCLFLSNTTGTWTAKMVPWGASNKNCADGHITVGPGVGKDLTVRRPTIAGGGAFTGDDYPPVARWDWDSAHAQAYLGIRCGAEWCEIGATSGFTPSPGYTGPLLSFDAIAGAPPLPANAALRVQRIKGWYDVQELGVWADGSTQPSGVRGVLIPHPALDAINWLNFRLDASASLRIFQKTWVHVGYAVMQGDYPKWNLKSGTNKISLCYGTSDAESCNVPTGMALEYAYATSLSNCPTDPTDNALRWWAKTESSAGVTYSCVRRMDHRAHLLAWEGIGANSGLVYRIPGAARWYFMPEDESTWYSCPTGCCSRL
jgi:hypothetical protein